MSINTLQDETYNTQRWRIAQVFSQTCLINIPEKGDVMSATIDVLHPEKPKRVLMIASNPTVSKQTGWPIGFWASELIHPYYEFTEHGYKVDIVSPRGGKLEVDSFSNPEDPSKYSEDDILSLGFLKSPKHAALIERTPALKDVNPDEYAAIMVVGGQGPMYTFIDDEDLHRFIAHFYEAGKVTC